MASNQTPIMKIMPIGKDLKVKSLRDKLFITDKEPTFSYEETLPSLPIPSLEQTLQKYLESVKPHVTSDEYRETEQIVEKFKNGVGKELQAKLIQNKGHSRNWLEKWWEDMAYLSNRSPLLPLTTMVGAYTLRDLWPPQADVQTERAALVINYVMNFWKLIRSEQLRPQISRDQPYSMYQISRLFNTARIPAESKDEIRCHFKTVSQGSCGPRHLVVLCRGYAFIFDAIDSGEVPLSPLEVHSQLEHIQRWCDSRAEGPGVGILTAGDRDAWAKNRKSLCRIQTNKTNLELIESALLVVVLDDGTPDSNSEIIYETLCGDSSNRWADKSVNLVFYRNGVLGFMAEHSPFDGMATLAMCMYMHLSAFDNREGLKISNLKRPLPHPKRLDFVCSDELKQAIEVTRAENVKLNDNCQCLQKTFTAYGKDFIKPLRIHPEAYVQMALQLAYYRLHGKAGSTYCTATTRKFYHGRTETVRSCVQEGIDWFRAMGNPTLPVGEVRRLLKRATDKVSAEMKEATENRGCDRHLLGLYATSVEEGYPLPDIFMDPSFIKSGGAGNFTLSSSLSGYTPLIGSVMPMREDGYGVFYSIEDNDIIFIVTAFRSCPETDVDVLYTSIERSLTDMQELLTQANL